MSTQDAQSCLNCGLALWDRTKAGKLHPSGDGRCQWVMPVIHHPQCISYPGDYGRPKISLVRAPSGHPHIDRKKPYTECKTWKPVKDSP